MSRIILCFYFIVAIWMQRTVNCGLISQSSITKCEWGNSQEPTTGKDKATCKKKFVISMTLKSGQGEVEALYANVRQAYVEGTSDMSTLKKPFRIEISKTQAIASYRAYYRGSVNGGPKEEVVYYHHPNDCKDAWRHERLSCGKQKTIKTGKYAWDSQGFCCRCNYETREMRRPNATCERRIFDGNYHGYYVANGAKKRFGSSAHCMRLHPIWFDVFSLDQPMMQYNITIKLLQFNGFTIDPTTETESANWTIISTFYLNPSKTIGRSKDGRVIAELQGDLLGAQGPLDLTTKMLLIPSINLVGKGRKKPFTLNRDPKYWLLVDETMVDLSGLQCNKVGTSYSGFRRQPGRCHQNFKSCFTNQPFDLLKHDTVLLKKKKKGSYMLRNFGRIHPSTKNNDHSFIVRLIHDDLHNSFVTFRIDASDIQFVYNVGKGRIVDARTASDFKALTEVGTMHVEVENTGEIVADFTVVLSECFGRKNLPGKQITIEPGRIGNVTFFLQSYKMFGETSVCEVQLFDSDFNLLGTAKVDVKVKSNCFCYGACGCSCLDDGTTTMMECPTPPPIIIEEKGVFVKVFLLCLEIIGPQGIIGFFASLLLFFGCIKLCFGGILFCRKSKAQEHFDNMKEKGVPMKKGPELVKCAGECRGAKAAKARYKRKVERIKKMGKTVRDLDDWRNTSFICTCHEELADIRFLQVIKALFFFYYVLFVPFIWLGKKLWWGIFKDTAAKKEAAKKTVLKQAKKKGELEKYGIVDIGAELKKMKDESKSLAKAENKPDDSKPPDYSVKQTALNLGTFTTVGLEGITEVESNLKTKKNKKGKSAKKTARDVDSKKKLAVKGTADDKKGKMIKDGTTGPGGRNKGDIVDAKRSKHLMKEKDASEVDSKDRQFLEDKAQRDKKQYSAERKVERPPQDKKQHQPMSSANKQKTYKEYKPSKSSGKSQRVSHSSKPTHSNKGSKSLSPDKHSSTSIASGKDRESKQSIARKHSSHSAGQHSSESVKSPTKVPLTSDSSKISLEDANKSHQNIVGKNSSHSSNVSKDSSHISKSGSHSKQESSHSSHSSRSDSHSSHISSLNSSHSSNTGSHSVIDSSKSESGSESHSSSPSKHTHLYSSSDHTSLSSIKPDHSGRSLLSELSFATGISSVSSILPLSLTHSSQSGESTLSISHSDSEVSGQGSSSDNQSGSEDSKSHHTGSHSDSDDHTGSHSDSDDHTGSHSDSDDHTGSHSDSDDHTGSHSDSDDHTGSHSDSDDHTGSHSDCDDHTGSHSDSDDHTDEDTEGEESEEHETSSEIEEEHFSSSNSSEESSDDETESDTASSDSESESSDHHTSDHESGSSEPSTASAHTHTESVVSNSDYYDS